jgi:hypothetical protein
MVAHRGRHKTSVKRKNLKKVFHRPCQAFHGWGPAKKAEKTTVTKRTNRTGAIVVSQVRI